MTVVIGTAGHIDHGKTALLRALTGIDADRLPEERRRGMTIDVGYAHLQLPDGSELDFVDVPGHDRLVGNMLVGAGEIDAVLVVVAADDGPRAQTLEHLELLDGLGIGVGVAAVTKVDAVEPSRVAHVVAEVGELLGLTTLAGSPVVAVSALRGDGMAELLARLAEVAVRLGASVVPSAPGVPAASVRLAIDRVFTVRGRGLVVTGTARGGPLSRGDALRLEPAGRTARVREVQVHGSAVGHLAGGGRAALNLAGVDEPVPSRGDVLTTDPDVRSTTGVLALIRRPTALDRSAERSPWPPRPGSIARLHIGTAQVDATFGRGPRAGVDLEDGRRVVRLSLGGSIAAAPGDRFVLRRSSPAGTLAGGVVLDASPPVGPSRRRITPDLLADLGRHGTNEASLLALHGVRPTVAGTGTADWTLAADVEAALREVVLTELAEVGAAGASLAEMRPAVARRLRRLTAVTPRSAATIASSVIEGLIEEGSVVRDGDSLRGPGIAPAGGPSPEVVAAMDRLERALDVPAPPALDGAARAVGCPPDGIRALESAGRIVRLDDDLAYAAAAFARMQEAALRIAAGRPMLPADLRDATGTSRKYVMAVIEELDRRGVLRRTAEGHVPGPRAGR